MGRRLFSLLLALALAACAAQPANFAYDEPGPTLMARTADGYAMTNRRLRLLIDAATGDALAFGPLNGRSAIAIAATRNGAIHPMQGYLEARDNQTWEYLGDETQDMVSWRKIYCLDGDRLLVTYLIRNEGKAPIDTQIGIAPLPATTTQSAATQPTMGWRALGPNDDLIESASFRIKCFNEAILPVPPMPEILHNDPRRLAPGEGIAWTMVWSFATPSESKE